MTILNEKPPNYGKIFEAIPDIYYYPKAVFCYGDTIYNPSGAPLPSQIVVHEEVHSKQQGAMGVELWWDRYLASESFRFEQEVPAYQAQWIEYCKHVTDRNERVRYLTAISRELTGEVYGAPIRSLEAAQIITNGH